MLITKEGEAYLAKIKPRQKKKALGKVSLTVLNFITIFVLSVLGFRFIWHPTILCWHWTTDITWRSNLCSQVQGRVVLLHKTFNNYLLNFIFKIHSSVHRCECKGHILRCVSLCESSSLCGKLMYLIWAADNQMRLCLLVVNIDLCWSDILWDHQTKKKILKRKMTLKRISSNFLSQ